MEREFRIRAEIIYGGVEATPSADANTAGADSTEHDDAPSTEADAASRSASHERGMGGDDGLPLHAGVPCQETDWESKEGQRTAGAAPDPDAGGRTAESAETSGADERTGWEAERDAFFSAQHQPAQTATAAPG